MISEIAFDKKEIIYSMIICCLSFLFFTYLFFTHYDYTKPICLIWIIVISKVFIKRYQQLKKYKNGTSGLIINSTGIQNNTLVKPFFVKWAEIKEFQLSGSIIEDFYIVPNDINSFKRQKIGKLYLNSKPECLIIDIKMLNIKGKDLLTMLNAKKSTINHKN